MKKLLSRLALFLTGTAMAIGVGVAAINSVYKEVRAEETLFTTLSFPDDNSANNGVQNYTSTWEAKSGSFSWTITNFNNSNWGYGWNNIGAVRKNDASIATITNKNAFNKKIFKVIVNVSQLVTADINSQKLYVASNSTFTENLQTITVDIISGNNSFIIPNPTSNQFYKLEYDCKPSTENTPKNGSLRISSISYYYDTDNDDTTLDHLEITHAPDKTTYLAGDTFDTTGLTVRAHYSDSTYADLDLNNCTISPTVIAAETTQCGS